MRLGIDFVVFLFLPLPLVLGLFSFEVYAGCQFGKFSAIISSHSSAGPAFFFSLPEALINKITSFVMALSGPGGIGPWPLVFFPIFQHLPSEFWPASSMHSWETSCLQEVGKTGKRCLLISQRTRSRNTSYLVTVSPTRETGDKRLIWIQLVY